MFHCSIKSVQHSLHPNFCGQLGNTRMWPLTLRSIGRQLRDAPSDWRRSSFAFPGLRRFHRLSCHSRPDRRGPIRSITPRPWLLRSSQHCDVKPCLTVGATTNSVVHIGSFSLQPTHRSSRKVIRYVSQRDNPAQSVWTLSQNEHQLDGLSPIPPLLW